MRIVCLYILISKIFWFLRRCVRCSWKLFGLEIISHSTSTLTWMNKPFTSQVFLASSAIANRASASQYTHQKLSWQVQILCSAKMTLATEWQSWYRGGKSEWQNNQFFSSSENEPSLLYIHLVPQANKTQWNKRLSSKQSPVLWQELAIFMWNKCSRVILYQQYFVIESIL